MNKQQAEERAARLDARVEGLERLSGEREKAVEGLVKGVSERVESSQRESVQSMEELRRDLGQFATVEAMEAVEAVMAEAATEAATASAAPLSADDAALSLRNVSLTLEEALEETAPAGTAPPAAEPPPAVEPPPVEPAAPAAAPRRSLLDSMGSTWRRLTKLCLLYTSPSPRDRQKSRMPSSA